MKMYNSLTFSSMLFLNTGFPNYSLNIYWYFLNSILSYNELCARFYIKQLFFCGISIFNSIYCTSSHYGLSRWLGRGKWPRGSKNISNLYSSYVYLCIVCKNDSFVHTRQKHRLFSLYAYFWHNVCFLFCVMKFLLSPSTQLIWEWQFAIKHGV